MRTAIFSVACMAYYKSELDIPDSVPKGKELEYRRQHLDECSTGEGLEWLSDLEPEEAVTKDDILNIKEW